MAKQITYYVLVTKIVGKDRYVRSTTKRDFDKRLLIDLTPDIDKAFLFDHKQFALDTLSRCITNDREYFVETYQTKAEKPLEKLLSDKAKENFI